MAGSTRHGLVALFRRGLERGFQFHFQARLRLVFAIRLILRRSGGLRRLRLGAGLAIAAVIGLPLARRDALRQHDPIVMFGMLEKILRADAVARSIGIAGQLAIPLEDMAGRAADFYIGAVAVEIAMGVAATTTAATIHSAPAMGAPALLTAAALTIFIHVSSRSVEKTALGKKSLFGK